MALAIETHGLCKAYGHFQAVDDIDLRVRPGEIYGFLGLNGAGKTTTIRTLLGMIRPSAGSIKVLGETVGPGGRGPWHRLGHLVESPVAYPELTVRENLEIARRLQQVSDANATDRIIDQMGISRYAHTRAGTLSMGNLQRLGLARALLHGPELLILDEPINGLDPAGVVEIRELLVGLARDRGVTIFMSSHILSEVERLANRIGIIHQGRLIEELDAQSLEALRDWRLEVRTRDAAAATAALARAGYTVERRDDTLILKEARAIEAPDAVATLLVNNDTPPLRLAVVQEDLEAHFLRLTGGEK